MGLPEASESEDLSSKMEVDAFRRLFPLRYFERHLAESIRPDARPVGRARDTTVSLGQLGLVPQFFKILFIFVFS